MSAQYPLLKRESNIQFPTFEKGEQGGIFCTSTTPASQRGIVIPFVTIAMLALIGMAGLALDMGHAFVNKTRLQNALDAAALSGAKTLDQFPGDLVKAELDAKTTFSLTAAGSGNEELNAEVNDSEVTVEFYAMLVPLQPPVAPGSVDARYVRVSVDSFNKTMFLAQVLPGVGNAMTIGGSAVAGPSPKLEELCDLVPIMLCAGDAAGEGTVYGYTVGTQYRMTSPPGNYSDVGPGNFRLIRLGGSGASVVRSNLAGGFSECFSEEADSIETEPGLDWGPVAQGLNTRFGMYSGGGVNPADHPADTNTCQSEPLTPHYTYAEYSATEYCTGTPDNGGSERMRERRVVTIPIADCSGDNTGQSTLPLAGYACMFLTRRVEQGGGPASGVWGEMMEDGCITYGTPGEDPGTGPGPHTIQLYQDPLSNDS